MRLTVMRLFQVHKGAMRTAMSKPSCATMVNFNSIKVRLELVQRYVRTSAKDKFQFHKGAIRTDAAVPQGCELCQFQFHKGAIRTLILAG